MLLARNGHTSTPSLGRTPRCDSDGFINICQTHRGIADGDGSVWHLFSKVLALVADIPTIRRRIDARPNQFGKVPEELAAVLGRQASYEADYRRYGAIIIDATRPLDEVVDEILAVSANDLP
jgi:hypothetical protein